MKIITIARTRDSADFIDRFCQSYYWVDQVLIADGGSSDDSKKRASQYPNVTVKDFSEKVYRGDTWRNPHGRHINFLIKWAEEEGADWIIFDDVDCVPNFLIKDEFNMIFNDAEEDGNEFIFANRAYIYGEYQYFEKLTKPTVLIGQYENEWIPSLWAWKANMGFAAKENDPFKHEFNKIPTQHSRLELYPPYCLLHYFYPNDEYMRKKLEFYNKIYDFGTARVRDPKEYGGQLLPLEGWMKE